MSSNKETAVRFFEGQDRNKGAPLQEICSPTYMACIGGGPAIDLAGHTQFGEMFYAAFPDMSHRIDDMIAEGDKVTVRFTLNGTHRGEFMGVPATGKSVSIPALALLRFEDGKVAELWGEFNGLGVMQQLEA